MCGIAGGAGRPDRRSVIEMIRLTAHRGPDGQGFVARPPERPVVVLGHARLAIVDPAGGAQPLRDEGGQTWAVVNGEIYNHSVLRQELEARGHRLQTGSDAEVLVHLVEEAAGNHGRRGGQGGDGGRAECDPFPRAVGRLFARLDGMFAAAVWRGRPNGGGWLVLGRDVLGIRPLYWGQGGGSVYFASEMKAVRRACRNYREFPPGHVGVWCVAPDGSIEGAWLYPFRDLPWQWAKEAGRAVPPAGQADDAATRPDVAAVEWAGMADEGVGVGPASDAEGHVELGEVEQALERAVDELHPLLERAVVKRLMADVPVGVLLSGGVDSTLVTALARRHYPLRLHSFAVGTAGSPDLEASIEAARLLGTTHHVRRFGAREARALLPRVIYHLESFDAPLVRSALANYLVFEMASDYVKVVLTGEGSDELFAGYEALRDLAGARLERELRRLLGSLHHTNLQRADRMGLAHGVEARVPFLDLEVVGWALHLPPELKRSRLPGKGEQDKRVVRALAGRFLPPGLAWRPKAKFSQGSGAAPVLRQLAEELITDREWTRLAARFPDVPLASREQALYFRLFLEHFPEEAARQAVGITRSVVPGEVA